MRTTKDDHFQKLCRSLFIALCNRAKARSKLKNFHNALQDCDHTLELDATHLKNLLCKVGKMQKFGAFVENGVFGYFRLVGFKWVRGKVPELQDHIGAVEIRKSEINGRWLFSTKNMCWVVVIGHQGNSQVT
ncbi:hypothetical protein AAZX31_18G218900 [Glycine max]